MLLNVQLFPVPQFPPCPSPDSRGPSWPAGVLGRKEEAPGTGRGLAQRREDLLWAGILGLPQEGGDAAGPVGYSFAAQTPHQPEVVESVCFLSHIPPSCCHSRLGWRRHSISRLPASPTATHGYGSPLSSSPLCPPLSPSSPWTVSFCCCLVYILGQMSRCLKSCLLHRSGSPFHSTSAALSNVFQFCTIMI